MFLYPIKNVRNFNVTFDDWEYIHELQKKIKNNKKKLYEIQETKNIDKSNELKKLQNQYNLISKSPKTITNVINDLSKIKESNSYFYRKFSKDSDIEKYWNSIINN